MAEPTPHLARATEAVREKRVRSLAPLASVARAAVSAALHDPDDPDWLARRLFEYDYEHGREARTGYKAPTWPPPSPWEREMYQERAAVVRAAILGEP